MNEVPKLPRGDIKCRFGCDSPAEGIYHAPAGCICWNDPIQALCKQHEVKIQSDAPVTMLVKLTPELIWEPM